MARPLAIHLEPRDREPFLRGDLVPMNEVQIVDVRGPWDAETLSLAADLIAGGKSVYLYLQFFTAPLYEWRNVEPMKTLGELPVIPAVKAWAQGREAIDYARVRIPVAVPVLPDLVGVAVDNYFPELEPWMFGADQWQRVPGLGELKRKTYSRIARAFITQFGGRTILNGRPDPSERCEWIMVERAAARKAEAEHVASTGKALLSVPAEETYNIQWLLDRWKDGNAISFTSDSVDGLQSPASLYAYELAIRWRKQLGG